MSKAYDRIEWNFLKSMMLKMGFCNQWVSIIWECISTIEYLILIDNTEISPIKPQCGLRQCGPLSRYLFILVQKGLSAMIQNQERRGVIHGVAISTSALKVSHLLFVDDCFLFFKANSMESQVIKDILNEFATASGQIINYNNSSVAYSKNVTPETMEIVKDMCWASEAGRSAEFSTLP